MILFLDIMLKGMLYRRIVHLRAYLLIYSLFIEAEGLLLSFCNFSVLADGLQNGIITNKEIIIGLFDVPAFIGHEGIVGIISPCGDVLLSEGIEAAKGFEIGVFGIN